MVRSLSRSDVMPSPGDYRSPIGSSPKHCCAIVGELCKAGIEQPAQPGRLAGVHLVFEVDCERLGSKLASQDQISAGFREKYTIPAVHCELSGTMTGVQP